MHVSCARLQHTIDSEYSFIVEHYLQDLLQPGSASSSGDAHNPNSKQREKRSLLSSNMTSMGEGNSAPAIVSDQLNTLLESLTVRDRGQGMDNRGEADGQWQEELDAE